MRSAQETRRVGVTVLALGLLGLGTLTDAACRPSAPPPGADHDSAPAPTGSGAVAASASASGAPSAPAGAESGAAHADAAAPLVTGSTHATGDGGVSEGADAGLTDAGASQIITLDESSDGKTIDVARGQTLVLMLAANPTTGFDWTVVKAPPGLGEPVMGYISGGDALGAPGKRRISFKVVTALPATGEQPLELAYKRSFEKVAALKTFRVKLRAKR
jgi:predicted secreted protein